MKGSPVHLTDLAGGINLRDQPYKLANNECRDAQNIVFGSRGAFSKRRGSVQFTDSGLDVTPVSLHYFRTDGGTDWLIASGTTKLYKITNAGVTGSIKTGLTTGLKWQFINYLSTGGQGPLWGMNGTDTPQQWDGAAATTSDWTAAAGSVPNGKYCAVFQNYVYVAGTSANPSRLTFSNLGDPRTWTAADYVDLHPMGGHVITGMAQYLDLLVVTKQRSVYAVFNACTGANRLIESAVGCPSPRSLVATNKGVVFFGYDNVYITDGVRVRPITTHIQSYFRDSINTAQYDIFAGTYWRGHYYLALAGTASSTNNVVLDLDLNQLDLGAGTCVVSKHTFPINQFAIIGDVLYGARSDTSKVVSLFDTSVWQDTGSNYTAYWTGPWVNFGTPYRSTRLRQIHLTGDGLCTADVYKDLSASADQSPSLNLDTTGWTQIDEPGAARNWSIKFTNSATNANFDVYSLTWAAQPREE